MNKQTPWTLKCLKLKKKLKTRTLQMHMQTLLQIPLLIQRPIPNTESIWNYDSIGSIAPLLRNPPVYCSPYTETSNRPSGLLEKQCMHNVIWTPCITNQLWPGAHPQQLGPLCRAGGRGRVTGSIPRCWSFSGVANPSCRALAKLRLISREGAPIGP